MKCFTIPKPNFQGYNSIVMLVYKKKINLYLKIMFYCKRVRKNYFLFLQNLEFNEGEDMW